MSRFTEMNNGIKLSDDEKERLIGVLSENKKTKRRPAGVIAAALCVLLAVIGVFVVKNLSASPAVSPSVPETGGVTVPKTEISLADTANDSSVAFIVYGGRVYFGGSIVYHEEDANKIDPGCIFDEYYDISEKLRYRIYPFTVNAAAYEALLGECIGTCTDTPDLCVSEADRERVQKAFDDPSSENLFGMEGDYYTLRGVPAEKCLVCVSVLDACRTVMPMFCLNGVTLYGGSDVFGDLLDIKNAKKVQWVTDDEWNEGLDEAVYYHDGETPGGTALKDLDVPEEIWNGFIGELNDSVPVVRSEQTYKDFEKDMYEQPSGHLYITLANGLLVKLRVFSNGYVSCDCSFDLLFKLNGENWQRILETTR